MRKIFLLLFLLSACSSGFHREDLRSSLRDAPVVTVEEVGLELAKRPQLPRPFRLGVYFKEPIPGHEGERKLARWSEEERWILQGVSLPAEEVSQYFRVSPELVQSPALGDVRKAAARQGADAVLIISGAQETNLRPNLLSSFYLLLLPVFFVNGTEMETYFAARASLWDVRNEYLYLGAEAESERAAARPRASLNRETFLLKTRVEALERLKVELTRQLQGIVGAKI